MLSYRDALNRIGIKAGQPQKYLDFTIRPKSLRTMMTIWTFAPSNWKQVSDIYVDETWTEECQGVACHNHRWIFSSNGSQPVTITWETAAAGAILGGVLGGPAGALVGAGIGWLLSKATGPWVVTFGSNPRALYFFRAGGSLRDEDIVQTVNIDEIVPKSDLNLHHVGNLDVLNDKIFVSHWNHQDVARAQIIVLNSDGGYERCFDIEAPFAAPPDGDMNFEMEAVLPDGNFFTSQSDTHSTFFVHDKDGKFLKTMKLSGDVHDYQGSTCSPNGKVYISTNMTDADDTVQFILVVSLLNGFVFGQIPVAAGKGYELEGVFFKHTAWPDGRSAELHGVLLENHMVARDNVFFKSFASDRPDLS